MDALVILSVPTRTLFGYGHGCTAVRRLSGMSTLRVWARMLCLSRGKKRTSSSVCPDRPKTFKIRCGFAAILFSCSFPLMFPFYPFGYIAILSPYTPYSIYLRGTIPKYILNPNQPFGLSGLEELRPRTVFGHRPKDAEA